VGIDRVILVGFMGSGKSTVGRALADRLGWELIDFDEEIERAQGRPIAEIFRQAGEAAFRRLEAQLTDRLRDRRNAVMAPGGGWMVRPDLVDTLRPGSLIVWLRARPETLYRRHLGQGVPRPLLAVERPREAIDGILAEREAHYKKAHATVDTDEKDPATVADEIVARLRLAAP
jgi:shikimate kinase